MHQTMRRRTYVGQGTSASNNEKWNLCRTWHICIKQWEMELMSDMTHLHQTMRNGTYIGHDTSASNNEKWNVGMAHLHQTMRSGTYVGHDTSASNNEKWNLCRTRHICIKQWEMELILEWTTCLYTSLYGFICVSRVRDCVQVIPAYPPGGDTSAGTFGNGHATSVT